MDRLLMKRVYISGPRAGYPELNWPKFHRAAKAVVHRGFQPAIPHHIPPFQHEGPCRRVYNVEGPEPLPPEHDGGCHVRADIAVMLQCDEVWVLPGWTLNIRANLEVQVARMFKIPLYAFSYVEGDPAGKLWSLPRRGAK